MSKRWKIKAVNLFLTIFTRWNGRLKFAQSVSREQEFRHIVIYSTTALGDFLFNSPAIRAVRLRYPTATITLVAHEKFREFLQNGEDWNRVVWWNNKFSSMRTMIKALKEEQGPPDLALLLHSHEPYDYLSAVLAGSQYVIRDNYYDGFDARDRWLADYTIGYVGHIIQRKMALVEPLGCDASDHEMKLPIKLAEPTPRNILTVGFQMGASKPDRCWAPKHFAQVAAALLQQSDDLRIALIGGPGEKSLVADFWQYLDARFQSRITDYVGTTGLIQLTELINEFSVLLTGDTGPLHIAIAAKTPTVSLFVNANPYSTGPFQDRHMHDVIYVARRKSNQHVANAMDLITPECVIEKVSERLKLIALEKLHHDVQE